MVFADLGFKVHECWLVHQNPLLGVSSSFYVNLAGFYLKERASRPESLGSEILPRKYNNMYWCFFSTALSISNMAQTNHT